MALFSRNERRFFSFISRQIFFVSRYIFENHTWLFWFIREEIHRNLVSFETGAELPRSRQFFQSSAKLSESNKIFLAWPNIFKNLISSLGLARFVPFSHLLPHFSRPGKNQSGLEHQFFFYLWRFFPECPNFLMVNYTYLLWIVIPTTAESFKPTFFLLD